jgi:multiple antibiotic resistance protein
MLDYAEYIKIFIGLVAIVNPLGAVPIFISMTNDETRLERKRTVNQVAIGVCIILTVTLFFGQVMLQLFGITINSFKVGGGILVLLMAISMLHAKTSPIKQTDEEASESIEKSSVAIVPLAMPLLAGPGAIGTVILDAHKSQGVIHYLLTLLIIFALSLIIWGVLRMAPWIAEKMGSTGINVSTRIMGLILSAIAIEFIAGGLKGLFPGLS